LAAQFPRTYIDQRTGTPATSICDLMEGGHWPHEHVPEWQGVASARR
jgi:hypothetical protein